MRDRVLAAARDAGRDPAEITCAYNVGVRIGERAGDDPALLSGPPDAVVERLLGFTALGFTTFNFMPAGPGADEQVERLAREVLPELRRAVPA